MGGRGVQRLFLPYYYHFFLARFARQYYGNILNDIVYILQSSMFSMELSSSLYISLIQIMKRIQLPIPCFYERAFSDFSCLELHDFTPFKTEFFFWGRTQRPPTPRHMNNIKTTMSSVYMYREGLAILPKKKPHALPK